MKYLILSFVLIGFGGNFTMAQDLNSVSKSLNEQYIQLKIKYEAEDSLLFVDILDVMLSIKIDEKLKESNKIIYLKYLENFLADANTSIFSKKKIEERNYRRAVRFFPTLIFYSEEGTLEKLANYYPEEIINSLKLVPNQNILKTMILKIGLNDPKLIYRHLDELYHFTFVNEVVEQLIINYPQLSMYEYESNPYLKEIVDQSESAVIKKILSIKNNFGIQSSLYPYLNDIIQKGFNDTKEVDFEAYKMNYTKILLRIMLDEFSLGRYGAIDYLRNSSKWIYLKYLEDGREVFSDFTANELFILLTMSIHLAEREEAKELINYLKTSKNREVQVDAVRLIPDKVFDNLAKKLQYFQLTKDLYQTLDAEALNLFLEREKYKNLYKPSLKNTHWITTTYNPQKEKQDKETRRKNQIAKTFQLNKIQFSMLQWTRNLNKVDSNLKSILASPIGNAFLNYLCKNHPNIIFNNKETLMPRKDWGSIVSKVAYSSPNSIKKYLGQPENPFYKSLDSNNQEIGKLLFRIYNQYKFSTKAYSLIHLILTGKMTLEQVHSQSMSQTKYLQLLCEISTSKNPFGLNSVEAEQNELSLKLIREINDRPHVQNPTLLAIKSFEYNQIYSLMILGREELFDFTFSQFYQALLDQTGSFDILTFFESVQYYRFREFCNLLSEFDKFSSFIKNNSTPEERLIFFEKLIDIDFSDIRALEEAANISELLAKCTDPEIQELLQTNIKKRYEIASENQDQLAMAIYSLLAGNIGKRASIERKFFEEMEIKYAKHTHTKLKVKDLLQKSNKIVIVSYFYNDADGIASFNSFINTMKQLPNWFMKDMGSYFYISSILGTEIEFFANKPQTEKEGQRALAEYLTVNQLEPSIIIHRGHSYHSQKTIDQMIGSPKFIFMGSCGGYYKISELLERSPNAQILSTKQVGTMSINDPTLKKIIEMLRKNEDIDWVAFWDEQKNLLGKNKDFKDYVPPHKNNGALFINAFFEVVGLN